MVGQDGFHQQLRRQIFASALLQTLDFNWKLDFFEASAVCGHGVPLQLTLVAARGERANPQRRPLIDVRGAPEKQAEQPTIQGLGQHSSPSWKLHHSFSSERCILPQTGQAPQPRPL